MTDSELLSAFLDAMGGDWVVERYSVDDGGKLRVHYVSSRDPRLEWAHNPDNLLSETPKIGDVGMIGFIAKEQVDWIRRGTP